MPNVIRLSIEDVEPAELLNAGMYGAGGVIHVQWSATQAGSFADLTGTGSTPTVPIVANVRSYTGYDPNGTSSTWYRTRYENAGATRSSDWSTAFLVGATGYCSLDLVKHILGRTDPTDTLDDELLLKYIAWVSDYIDSETDRHFLPDPNTVYTFNGDQLEDGRMLPVPRGVRSLSLVELAFYTGAAFISIPLSDVFILPTPQERAPGWPGTEIWMSDIPSAGNAQPFFASGFAVARFTGAFGFAACPPRVEELAASLVVRSWSARQGGQADVAGSGDSGQPLIRRILDGRDRSTLMKLAYKPVLII
jgi:hypothetical protein